MSRVYYLHESPPESELYEEVTMPTVIEVTEEELQAYFEDSPMLQQTFGDFATYESFMGEQADLYDSGTLVKWWELDADAAGEDQDLHNWLLGNPYIDQGFLDDLDAVDSPYTIYQQQNMSPEMAALYEKYGLPSINPETGMYGSIQFEDAPDYRWTGTGWVKYREAPDNSLIGDIVQIGVPLFMTIATAGALQPLAVGALGSTLGGALSSVAGSALGTIATGGDIEFDSLLTSAILGGIGGFADALADGALAGTALDEAVWSMGDMLGISPGEVIDILEGVSTGAISGGDLESIVVGAVGGFGEAKVKDYLKDIFGDVLEVDDIFKDGASHIPIEALDPFIELGFDAMIEGGASAEDLLKAAFGYFSQGGDIDFLLPDTPEFDEFWDKVGGWIPGLDFEKGGWGIGYDPESGDIVINHDLPPVDLPDGGDFEFPEIPDVLECMEGWEWSDLYQECVQIEVPEIPDILPEGTDCEEGFAFDSLLGQCVEIDIDIPDVLPEGTDCEEGFHWDSLLGQCVEIDVEVPEVPDVVECMEGWEWSDLYGECVPKIQDDVDVLECMEGYEWSDLYGECVPKIQDDLDAVECMEGWEWSDLYGKCIEKINDDIDIDGPDIDGPDWNVGDPCSDEEGNLGFLNEMGLCDIQLPDLPPSSGNTAGAYTPTWGELFAYTPFTPATGKKIADVDLGLLSEARKILG